MKPTEKTFLQVEAACIQESKEDVRKQATKKRDGASSLSHFVLLARNVPGQASRAPPVERPLSLVGEDAWLRAGSGSAHGLVSLA